MQSKITTADFRDQSIFLGIDTHLKSWMVSIYTDEIEHKTFSQDPKVEILSNYLNRNFPNATFHCVYEAGFSGFWLAEELKKIGINCIIVNPGDVPSSGKERDQKRDKVDSRKLARGLRNGELEGIYIPDKQIQMDRLLIRAREKCSRDMRRMKSRIKMMLHFNGIMLPEKNKGKYWSKAFMKWLNAIELPGASGTYALRAYIKEYNFLKEADKDFLRQIKLLANEERYAANAKLLSSIPGISLAGAMSWLTEIADIRRFQNAEQLCSFIGLVPSSHSSGENERMGEMTRRGQKYLRTLLIEQTRTAVRNDPALALKYSEEMKRIGKNKATVKAARRLLKRLRHVWLHKEPYEKGRMK